MKFISPNMLTDSVRKLLDVWKESGLTDVVISKDRIGAYFRGEVVSLEGFTEDEMIELVEQTIPVKFEKEWGELITGGKLLKYSFGIHDCCIVRANLWNEGVTMRFIPLNPMEVVSEEDLSPVKRERFFHIEKGGKCSGKTTRIFAMVMDYSRREKGSVILTYEDPQEIYIQDEDVNFISIAKNDLRPEEVVDIAISSCASLLVVQHAGREEMEALKLAHECGINVIAEVRGENPVRRCENEGRI